MNLRLFLKSIFTTITAFFGGLFKTRKPPRMQFYSELRIGALPRHKNYVIPILHIRKHD